MYISNDVRYIGVNDKKIDLFEGMYSVPNGIAYNSYVIIDEQTAVFDTVDARFTEEWLANLRGQLNGRKPDYLIVTHMEPDHSASIARFVEEYPQAAVISSPKSFIMIKNYFGEIKCKQIPVVDGDSVSLGKHCLAFISAPMVHWPEVTMAYEQTEGILFSADAFGKFGALDVEEDWACEARRYYFGIVGKYGAQVQGVLKKLNGKRINAICPLHGPVLKENLNYYLNLYDVWSSYGVETEGVAIAYTSVYGNTKAAVELLAEELKARGVKVALNDLARCDMAEAIEDAFRYGKTVLATTTYNGGVFPFMREFINSLTERNFCNRTVGIIENGSWMPLAGKVIMGMLEKCKNLQYTGSVKILSALTQENREQIKMLAEELSK